nr:hypothetical protein [uncultured Halomonas sp.]
MEVVKVRVPFGERDGRMLAPTEVSRGLACQCRCPGCGASLIAKRLSKSGLHFFAHHNAPECPGGVESALHKMAKQIIQENARILTSQYNVSISVPYQGKLLTDVVAFSAKEEALYGVKLERRVDKWVPDIIASLASGKPIHIEILVTHKVKREKAKGLDNVLEIDLSAIDRSMPINKATLKNLVIYKAPRQWYRCSLYDRHGEVYKRIEQLKEKFDLENRLKAKYQVQISKLKSMQDAQIQEAYRESKQQDERFKTAERWLSERKNKIKLTEKTCLWGIPMFMILDIPIEDDWVFSVHRKVWQARLIFGFIYHADGTRRKSTISLGPAYNHVCKHYPLHEWLVDLRNIDEKELLKVTGCRVPCARSVVSRYLHYLTRNDINLLQSTGRRDVKDGLFRVLKNPLQ